MSPSSYGGGAHEWHCQSQCVKKYKNLAVPKIETFSDLEVNVRDR